MLDVFKVYFSCNICFGKHKSCSVFVSLELVLHLTLVGNVICDNRFTSLSNVWQSDNSLDHMHAQ